MNLPLGVAIAALCAALPFFNPALAEEMRQTERMFEGPPVDGAFRQSPIFPWDDRAAYAEISRQIERLEAEGMPDAYLALAQSTETEISERSGREIYVRDRKGLGLLFPESNDAEARAQVRAGRYVMLHSALEGRPYVLFTLGNSFENAPDPAAPRDFHLMLWRLAADKEMVPAIANFVAGNLVDRANLDPDMIEAYLRYGFDLNVPGGAYQVTSNLVDFYGYFDPTREDDGYFQRGLDRLKALGATAESKSKEAFALLNGVRMPQDAPRALEMLIELLSEDDPAFHQYVAIGYAYANGYGVLRDIDLARDVYVACLKTVQSAGCALNLGSYFVRPRDGVYRPVLAHAFYQLAEMRAREQGDQEVSAVVGGDLRATRADFPEFGAAAALARYTTLISEGRFEEIEEFADLRPFPR